MSLNFNSNLLAQVPSLLKRSILYMDNRTPPMENVINTINRVLTFNTFGLHLNTCLLKGVTAVFKTWMQSAFLLYLFVIWGVLYFFAQVIDFMKGWTSTMEENSTSGTNEISVRHVTLVAIIGTTVVSSQCMSPCWPLLGLLSWCPIFNSMLPQLIWRSGIRIWNLWLPDLQMSYRGLMARHDKITPDSKVHGANMGPIWGRQDPGGPHVGPMNLAIWEH